MERVIPPRAYTADWLYAHELPCLRETWHFVGLRRDVAEHQAWIMTRVVDREVVVQNFHGELRAFTNVCTHRFNALRCEPEGRGPLVCRYHRWSFDRDGLPTGVPFRDGFGHLDRERLRLDRWRVETFGEFVFVHAGMKGPSFDSWLGEGAAAVERFGRSLGASYGSFALEVAANWKLVVQNTLEFDHVYSVHPGSFGQVTGPRPRLDLSSIPLPHVGYRSALTPWQPTRTVDKRIAQLVAPLYRDSIDVYEHTLLFPLTALGVYRGKSFSIMRYLPRAPNLTTVQVTLFLPRHDELSEYDRVLLESQTSFMLESGEQVVREDASICESVQRGLANFDETSERTGLLGEGERAVGLFVDGYTDFMARFPAARRPQG